MIYSVFDPYRGDFEYFEAGDDRKINDDQPIPSFSARSVGPLGVSSLEAGRAVPPGARRVGRGKVAKGRVGRIAIPGEPTVSRSNSGGPDGLGSFSLPTPTPRGVAVLVACAIVGFAIIRRAR